MNDHHMDEPQIKAILEQLPNYTISLNTEELKNIKTKTMIVLGDQDTSIPLEFVLEARNNISDFYLWNLPNTGHVAHEGINKSLFVELSKSFFAEQWNKAK